MVKQPGNDETKSLDHSEGIMTTYVIAFRVISELRKAQLIERIKSYGRWMSYFDGAFLISTNVEVNVIQQDLMSRITQADSILIVQAVPSVAGGYLPESAWTWLQSVQ